MAAKLLGWERASRLPYQLPTPDLQLETLHLTVLCSTTLVGFVLLNFYDRFRSSFQLFSVLYALGAMD